MARQGRKQADLAQYLDVTQSAISRRLAGKQPFPLADLAEVARFLEVPLASLIPGSAGDDVAGQAVGNSGQHSVSSAPVDGDAESRERLDRPAARTRQQVSA
jgi:transcriptional regulator with XRE-family HTH domain